MKLLIFYRKHSEHARLVDEFTKDFLKLHPDQKIDTIDIDTVNGSTQAELYDLMQFPALVVTRNDGALEMSWLGEPMPLIDQVFGYLTM